MYNKIKLTPQNSTDAIISFIAHYDDKQSAWDEIIKFTSQNNQIRRTAMQALVSIISLVPDIQKAWDDLVILASSVDSQVRNIAMNALACNFSRVPDIQKAWDDLVMLTSKGDVGVRKIAVKSLKCAFILLENKESAWDDLLMLTSHKDPNVRIFIASTLVSVFPLLPNSQKHHEDLHNLVGHKDRKVRSTVASIFAFVYRYPIDKQKTWDDLMQLTVDEDIGVRRNAFYSLGNISIFNASIAENEGNYKKELEVAISNFEKASQESTLINPSQFCLPFYRSFYTIIFAEKQQAKNEVDKCLIEVKKSIGGSNNKKLLYDVVENLGNALKECLDSDNMDLETKKDELSFYRIYCDRAAELMEDTEHCTPFATKVLEKGLPILDRNLKELLEETRVKSRIICEQTKGTHIEKFGTLLYQDTKQLESGYYDSQMGDKINQALSTIDTIARNVVSSSRIKEISEKINNVKKDADIKAKLDLLLSVGDNILSLIPSKMVKIGTVQIDFELDPDTFPPKLKNEDSIKKKILDALSVAHKENVDIVCFPELCICEDWLSEIESQNQNMIIIPGTYYDKHHHNVCKLICSDNISLPSQMKMTPSDFEDPKITGQGMVAGKRINIYDETKFGKFAILICRDFGNHSSDYKGRVNIIFVPSYNSANKRFHDIAHIHVADSPSYIIISNAAKYGGTSIFGRMRNTYFSGLERKGYKQKGDKSYKLCEMEKDKEGIIIADFDLVNKSFSTQTPMDPKEDKAPVSGIKKIIFGSEENLSKSTSIDYN